MAFEVKAVVEVNELNVRSFLKIEQLTLPAGSFTALCGPNGAGKSTLLSALAGYLPIDSGSIELLRRPLPSYSALELAKVRCWLAQKPATLAHFTVGEKLNQVAEFWLASHHQLARRRELVSQLLSALDLESKFKTPLWQLSGGELQRSYIAATLLGAESVANPQNQLVLLDEPLAGLDLHHQQSVMHWLKRYAERGAAVVVSLHDLNLALVHHLDVCLLEGGRLHSAGAGAAVLNQESLKQVFGVDMAQIEVNGSPQLVFI
jgi:vitamin B12 transport system ATP-binding protein